MVVCICCGAMPPSSIYLAQDHRRLKELNRLSKTITNKKAPQLALSSWLRGKELNLVCEIMSLTCSRTLPRTYPHPGQMGNPYYTPIMAKWQILVNAKSELFSKLIHEPPIIHVCIHDKINLKMPQQSAAVSSRQKSTASHQRIKRPGFIPPSIKHDRPSRHSFGSFLIRPPYIHTNVLEEDERVILLLRQHPIILVKHFLIIAFFFAVGAFVASSLNTSFLPPIFTTAFGLLWYLFLYSLIIEKIISWYFNVIIITDERIIDLDFLHLIYQNVTVTKLENIEDVTYSVTGVFPSLLGFGNVLIQTAGAVVSMAPQQTVASIEIWNTPNPGKVVNVLNDLILQEEQEKLEGRAK